MRVAGMVDWLRSAGTTQVRSLGLVAAFATVGMSARAAVTSTPVLNPATNNYYAYVTADAPGITWENASAEAATFIRDNVPGHLVTITSAAENQWVVDNMLMSGIPGFPSGYPVAADRYWIGGYQPPLSPEPAGGWTWVSGEPWSYTNWYTGEPNNGNGSGEERLAFWRENYTQPYDPTNPLQPPIGFWNDEPSAYAGKGYMVEWETPVPFDVAGALNYGYLIGTRADPGAGGPTVTFPMKGLDIRDSSTFTLGLNETLTLNGGVGKLIIGNGASFTANGAFQGVVQSAGLFATPADKMKTVNVTTGGVFHAVPPGQSVLISPESPLNTNAGTFMYVGGSGFALTNGGGGGPGVNPCNSLLDTVRLINNGVFAWDGRLAITGQYIQNAAGTTRIFIAGSTQGTRYSYLTASSPVSLDGSVQVVLEPSLFNYVPNVGTTFDVFHSDTSLSVAPGGLNVQTLMSAAGAASLGLSLPAYNSGFGADPNQLVSLPSNLFTYSVVGGGRTLRLTLSQPVCVPLTGPTSVELCPGGPAAFSVVSKGSGPTTYQWRKNAVNIPGATASSYSIASVVAGDGGNYDCVVTSPCGAIASNSAALTVDSVPSSSPPASVDACLGATASFTVAPSGTAPFTYQWKKNGTTIGGATSSTYLIPAAGPGDAGSYSCVISNACGSFTSGAASLSVITPASIASSPSPQTVCTGTPISLSVTAGGTGPFNYQWRKGGVNIGTPNSPTLSIASAVAGDAGSYDCVVSNLCGSATSNSASVTVHVSVSISANPSPVSTCAGSPASFSVAAAGESPINYQWRKNGVDIVGEISSSFSIPVTAEADAGSYDCVVTNTCGSVTSAPAALIVNSSVTSNPSPQTVCEGAPASFSVTASGTEPFTYQWRKDGVEISGATSTSLSFAAALAADTGTYDCVITNACGSIPSAPATLTVNLPATVNGNPAPMTLCEGLPASFSVTAGGTAPFTYQWRKNAVAIPGATASTYDIASVVVGDQASYDCVVTNSCATATSSAASLTVNTAASVTSNPTPQTLCAGSAASFAVTASGTAPISYQWRKDTVDIVGATGPTYAIAAAVPGDVGSYDCVVTNLCGSATSSPAALTVNVVPTTSNPSSAVACVGSTASFSVSAGGSAPFTYQWKKDSVDIPGATGQTLAIVSIATTDAASYECVVTNSCGTVTSSPATLTVNAPAAVAVGPQSQAVCPGSPASFTVNATGVSPITYQWRKNSTNIPGATSNTYAIAAAAAGDVASYDCVVTNSCGTATSSAAPLTLDTAASVASNPTPQTVCAGSPASFIVTASGTAPFTYQWRKDSTDIPGATSATYAIAAAAAGHAGSYDCVVTNSCGSATSSAASLSVNTATSVASNPLPLTVCAGTPASFTVTAAGTAPFTYQWRKNSTDIPGATSDTYAIVAATAADVANYDCVVTNSCGTATSSAASLAVDTAASVASNPTPQTVCEGSPASFTVVASGTAPFTYQWRKDSSDIPGATSTTYSIAAVAAGDVGNYDCVVTNSCGSATSSAASLTVNNAASVASNPTPQTVCDGSPASFSVVASGTAPFTYQWRKDSTDIPGATNANYAIAIASAGNVGSYDCVVTNSCGTATSSAASLAVDTAASVASNPLPLTVCDGSPASFSVAASGTAPFTYQWRKDSVDIPGATNATYTIAAAAAGDVGSYDCVVSNSCGSTTSSTASLSLDSAPSIAGNPAPQTVCEAAPASFTVIASGTAPFTYQWRKDATDIPGATTATYAIAAAAAGDVGSYDCVVTNSCGTATSSAASLAVNTATSIASNPVPQTVCDGSPVSFSVVASGTAPFTYQWRKDAIDVSGATGSSFAIAAAAASDVGSYDCVVTNSCGSATSSAASLAVDTAASIASNPAPQTVCDGSPASFAVVASGTAPFTYQWRKDSTDIPGATGDTYAIATATAADVGSYDCVVTNACGTATSSAASLAVNSSATISSNPSPQTVCPGLPVSFSVVAGGTPTPTYQWGKNGVDIPGATAPTFDIAAASSADGGSYACTVTNSCGSVTSSSALLTVQDSPAITTQPANQSHIVGSSAAFSVAATGTAPITYQWRKDSVDLADIPPFSGTTTADLSISSIAFADAASYDCVITNPCGSVTSDLATLAVNHCPADVDDGTGTGTFDGGVDINDLLFFLNQFQAGSFVVDLDDGTGTGTPDGGVDINDLLYFLAHFQNGC